MSASYRVAVQGFSAFEKATFESFFRLAARRTPAYEYVSEPGQADFVIADADQPEAVRAAQEQGRLARSVCIGARPVAGAAVQMPRPINLMLLLRTLDELVHQSRDTPDEPPVAAAVAAAAPALAEPVAAPPVIAAPPPRPPGVTDFRDSSTFSNSVLVEGDEKFDHILVVDDSDVALRFMQSRLRRFGFKVHLARSGEEALERLMERQFEFVFLDVMMEGMDGYQTCKRIKRMLLPPGRRAPVVVMLTSRTSAVDKIRGTLAGCDAYLTKPLVEDELVRVIGEHDAVFQRGFENTVASVATATRQGAEG
ncbi:response regulator [Caldimonas thermodepolymerans]|jgi:Response regulators consisting of a CheY-like receiver domain and a winged-helix DNA-binding domain|uniref:Response regulator receiver domain-containing protein n=1 Tax=Caldimonas thermodepolymerans TaxID=215580 RepID=A0A2S5T7T7_9BURK|nr:response regulator [Caldimonas thermodepolymerans]PPE71065.1 hypothetical protein C1702_03625 [Caldimonas thermodepolymerans]QPC31366.1 response regulator [Caldimonas thermodepolymerans]RDH99667.1 response regulator receiver domain-containing protein [Caldimonas thermodepolymerans]TCP07607.1 response regulator receiver domain-containing protein [Caldimonas thermodepolymerans]UZG44111.1 response regulator [Caldimonas thermodepolymerans]